MSLFNSESRDMTFDDVSEGLNIQGLQDYIQYLQVDVVQKIIDELENVSEVNGAIDRGWQGRSRDAFLANFEGTINSTSKEIKAEFRNLMGKLTTLAENYYEQDAKMVDKIS